MPRTLTAATVLAVSASVLAGCATVPASVISTAASPLRRVRSGMTFSEVVELLGPPTSQSRQVTAQAFNPFHVGGAGQITAFHYANLGRVYFTGPDLRGGGAQVVAVQEDAAERGR